MSSIRFIRLVFTLAMLVLGRSLQAADAANPTPADGTTANLTSYVSMDSLDNSQKLGIGDQISFRIIEDREEPKQLLVRESGELEIPFFRRIFAVDKTCKQLAEELKSLLEKDLYYHATVIIAIDTLSKSRGRVYLSGMVRLPGAQEIPSDDPSFTISKAILRAGGFSEFAAKKEIRITRKPKPGEKQNRQIFVDLVEILEKGKVEKDVKLEPEDFIFVPAKLINF